jgi:hypothetical protein
MNISRNKARTQPPKETLLPISKVKTNGHGITPPSPLFLVKLGIHNKIEQKLFPKTCFKA